MKAIKWLQTISLSLFICVLIGCSDGFSPTGNGAPGELPGTEALANNSYSEQIRLKPGRSYTFNGDNTGLADFYSLDITETGSIYDKDPEVFCKNLKVSGDSKNTENLGCQNRKFQSKSVTINNISDKMLDMNVILIGNRRAVK